VRKISSPKGVTSVPNLCNGRGQWERNMGKGECCSDFGERVYQFISGKCSMMGDPLEALRATREERKSQGFQIFQKDFGWEKRWGHGAEGKCRLGIMVASFHSGAVVETLEKASNPAEFFGSILHHANLFSMLS